MTPLVLLAAGCAGATPAARGGGSISVETSNFPTRETIAKIAGTPAPARLSDDRGKDVPTWTLEGPLPDAVDAAPSHDDSPWGKLLSDGDAVNRGTVVPTEAMRCVAREYAAFFLANEALPAEPLERFIAARCGAPTGQLGAAFHAIAGDDRIPDQKIFDQFRDKVKGMIDKVAAQGRLDAGVAYARKNGHAVIAITVTPRTARLERTPFVPGPDGKVVVRGELLGPAAGVRALINRGRYGYATCAADPSVPLPRFTITCEPAREDEVAWLTIYALPPGRVLGSPVLDMLVWPSGAPGKAYARLARPPGEAAAPATSASYAELVQEINRVRKDAGLGAVLLAEQESQTAARLAPHYFASFGGSAEGTVADQVALGLLAGWEVEGMVRHGHFVSTWLPGGAGYADVIHSALSRPLGRETLLDPAAERVAIGTLADGKVVGALLSSYALFDRYQHDADGKTVATRLAALRRTRPVMAPVEIAELDAAAVRAARSVQAGQRSPEEALNALLQYVSVQLGRSASGYVAETGSLEQMTMPEALLAAPALHFGVGVAHRRPAGHAWGRFVVFMIVLQEAGSVMTATRDGAHAG